MDMLHSTLMGDFVRLFVLFEKKRTPDGVGGFIETYTEGPAFNAALSLDDSLQAEIALQSGVTSRYTITTPPNLILDFHDVVKCLDDGKFFRITTDGDDKKTPPRASFQIRQVKAEEWRDPR